MNINFTGSITNFPIYSSGIVTSLVESFFKINLYLLSDYDDRLKDFEEADEAGNGLMLYAEVAKVALSLCFILLKNYSILYDWNFFDHYVNVIIYTKAFCTSFLPIQVDDASNCVPQLLHRQE